MTKYKLNYSQDYDYFVLSSQYLVAEIYYPIPYEYKDKEDAIKQHDEALNHFLDELEKLGINEKEIKINL